MNLKRRLAILFAFFLFACQPSPSTTILILDNDEVHRVQTLERVPSRLLEQAGITINAYDRVLVNGLPAAIDQPISEGSLTIQVRRAKNISISTSDIQTEIQSSAFTVGEALKEATDGSSNWLHAGERVRPGLNSPLSTLQSLISLAVLQPITIMSNRTLTNVSTSARTVGQALAEAGIPLLGLDYSIPAENDPLPSDGQIRVVHVSESLLLAQKPIPFESDFQASADVPLDQTQILQPGETGLNVQRIRIRYEDGQEISRVTENETMVRPPQTRILGYGTKIEIKTAVVDGVEIEYWRAVQMYATSYSPCRSGGDRCYPGTSSGKSLRKGMVAMRYSWYLSMGGQPLYIPGYGFATIEDVCGGCTGKPWIDLGYSDNDWEQWSSWVTVYFLTPVPANVIYVLE